MTIDEMINLDYNAVLAMSKKDLKIVVREMQKVVNRRYGVFARRGETSPAFRALEESGGKLTTRGDLNELRKEFTRGSNFLAGKTSSYTAYRAILKNTAKKVGQNSGIKTPSTDEMGSAWSTFDKLKELDQSVGESNLKYRTLGEVVKVIGVYKKAFGETPDKDKQKELATILQKRVKDIYEENERELQDDVRTAKTISDFTDGGDDLPL